MRHWPWVLAIAGVFLMGPGCTDARLHDIATVEAGGQFLVTPRWSSDGETLWVAGKGGVGSFRVSLAGMRISRMSLPPPAPSEAILPDGFRFEPYLGRILHRETILAEGAWGMRVSPDGLRIAFCTGHLSVSRLHVVDTVGRETFEGPGAQPAWHPDGTLLIFTRPESSAASGLQDADLYLLDLATGGVSRLTESAGSIEMQPAVSPDGSRLAFVDWASGSLLVADLIVPGGGS